MNDTTPRPDPAAPFGADTDEALSALIDGELAGFAAAHNTTEADARARLEAWDGYAARSRELGAARAASSTPVDPLDDLTRRRLVRAALAGTVATPSSGPRTRRRRASSTPWEWIAAAAAVLVVVVGVGLAATNLGSDNSSSSADKASSGADTFAQGSTTKESDGGTVFLGDVGNVDDPASVRSLEGRRSTPPSEPAPSEQAPNAPGDDLGGTEGSAAADAASDDAVAAQRCASSLASGRPVRFTAVATYQGAPAVVVGLSDAGRVVVFVVRRDECRTVLTSQSF